MKKQILSGLLCAVLVLTMLPSAALAAALPTEEEAAQVLSALDIMTGNENGDLMLDRNITKAEFTKLVIAASPLRDNVGPETATSPYPDVPHTHWAAGYIQAAVDAGLVRGNLYGYFEPDRNITLGEGVTMLLRLMGYSDSEFTGAYPAGQMAKYRALEMDKGVTVSSPSQAITRRDALFLFYNFALTKTKDGTAYMIDLIKPGKFLVNAAGELDTVALINSAMEGPLVADSGWTSKLPFDAATAKVYRSGSLSTLDAIQPNDVIYWSKPMRTLWVYTNRATGTIQAITPASAPTSVTLAGKTYALETTAAAYALSDLGPFQVGDPATLLLGRDGKVAAVIDPAQSTSIIYGMVTAVQPAGYTDADGNTYSDSTAYVSSTDGNVYSYRCDEKKVKVGQLVQVSTATGAVEIKTLSSASLSGRVSADGTRLGSLHLADDVEILDTYGKTEAVRVYPSRLAGMTLSESMIRWYQLDSSGDISRLILKDATGDMHTYGVVTVSNEVDMSMATQGAYVYDVGGQIRQFTDSKVYNVSKGPFLMKMDEGQVDRFANLNSVRLSDVDGYTAYAQNKTYLISEQVLVYELKNSDYYLSSLNVVTGGDFTLTGYYDKAESEGGRIRVIIAKA